MTILGEILDNLASRVIEGTTGNDLEKYAELLMQIHEVEPAFKGVPQRASPRDASLRPRGRLCRPE